MDAIVDALEDFFETIEDIIDFIVNFFSDLVTFIELLGNYLASIPSYLDFLPGGVVTALVSLFGIIVLLKILGRNE